MDFEEVEAIVTVSKSKSFNEAAFILNYAPSTISKAVISVEKEIGFKLFIRGNRASPAALTPEGEAIMPSFIRLYESMLQLRSDLDAIGSENKDLLRIGVTPQVSTGCRDKILMDFMLRYPECQIERFKNDFASSIHALYSGSVSGVFLFVLEGSKNYEMLEHIMEDPKIERINLKREDSVYLAISDKDPLAEKDIASFSEFRDFSIVFPTDKVTLVNAGLMQPFVKLSKNAGIELKTISLDPRDASTYFLATQMKIAIPTYRKDFTYPGIKYVQVSDWDCGSITCFLMLKTRRGKVLSNLLRCIDDYLISERLSQQPGSL